MEPSGKFSSMYRQHRPRALLICLCVLVYLAFVYHLVHSIRTGENGHFIYALDDPYIHLTLAENLAHGHYGINSTEYASPSSSLLWPFLLIPFANTPWHVYVPLFWNVLCGILAAALIAQAISEAPPQQNLHGRMSFLRQALTAILVLFAANLFSLALLGMEHSLQVLLSIACALGLKHSLAGRRIPWWSLAAAVLLPSVRYEGIALTGAVCLVLTAEHFWRRAIFVFLASVAPLAAFSYFLHSHGMPAFPMSVLVKAGNHRLSENLRSAFMQADHFPILIFLFFFAWLAWQEKLALRRRVFIAAAAVAAAQLLVGPFDWFHRYEVYALIFLLLISLHVLSELPSFSFAYFVLALFTCASTYMKATFETPTASFNIYQQQYQMHRFLTGFYSGENYAVNDLGLTSFERRPGAFVLDLYGLGSEEALRHKDHSAAWMESVVQRHDAHLAVIYPEWFQVPISWTSVARLCEPSHIVSAHACVYFYATDPAATQVIHDDLQRFSNTLPKEDILQFNPPPFTPGVD